MGRIIGNKKYVEIITPYIEKYGIWTIAEVDNLPDVQEILDKRLAPLPSSLEVFGFEVEGEEEESEPITITPDELHVIFKRAYLRKVVKEMSRSTAQSVVTFLGRTEGFVSSRAGVDFGCGDIVRAYSEIHPDEDALQEYKRPFLY